MRRSKQPLPLIGTDYKWYADKGVAKTDHHNIEAVDDNSPRVNYGYWFKNKQTQVRWYTDPEFTGIQRGRNKKNVYNYERIYNLNDAVKPNERLLRSSYVPYITTVSDDYWLLGSFSDLPEIKSDFGGSCYRKESPISCADRELSEETSNVLTEPVRRALNQNRVQIYKGTNNINNKVIIFMLVNMNLHFDDLDQIQQDIDQSTPTEKQGPLGFYKKSNLFKSSYFSGLYTSYNLTDFINFAVKNNML